MQGTIRYSAHAINRQAQRNLSAADVEFVMAHGRRIRCGGAIHVFLGGRDIPAEKPIAQRYGHLEGTMLVVSPLADELFVITAYRNRRALKQLRGKARYDRRTRLAD